MSIITIPLVEYHSLKKAERRLDALEKFDVYK